MRIIFVVMMMLFGFGIALTNHAQDTAQPTPADEQHSVPLEDIIIDDFSNFSDRFLPYSKATQEHILLAQNRSRPFCQELAASCFPPIYEAVAEANQWLKPDSLVLGYLTSQGQAYAYPFDILKFHGIVSDVIEEQPILITYCVYCNSAAIFSRALDGTILNFGNMSAYYQDIGTMYDLQTESLWLVIDGRAILGSYTDSKLEQLTATISTWALWEQTYPDTQVLARRENYVNYDQNIFTGYQTRINLGRFVFPVTAQLLADNRLQYGEQVLVVNLDQPDDAVAYPLAALGDGVKVDNLAGIDVAIFSLNSEGHMLGAAYQTHLEDGTPTDLSFDSETKLWYDGLTGSVIDFSGQFISGPLASQRLIPLTSSYTYWFAAIAINPEVTVYQLEG